MKEFRALVEAWRAEATQAMPYACDSVFLACADQLEQALAEEGIEKGLDKIRDLADELSTKSDSFPAAHCWSMEFHTAADMVAASTRRK